MPVNKVNVQTPRGFLGIILGIFKLLVLHFPDKRCILEIWQKSKIGQISGDLHDLLGSLLTRDTFWYCGSQWPPVARYQTDYLLRLPLVHFLREKLSDFKGNYLCESFNFLIISISKVALSSVETDK